MPTTLGKKYSTDWRGQPPHMLRQDVPVWYDFLTQYGHLFIALYYDVLLGGPWLTQEEEKDPMKRMWRANVAKRADAIAELENEVWIIEVNTEPGLRSLGQLMTYHALWLEDPLIIKPEKLLLVARTVDRDALAAAAQYGVQIYIMPHTTPQRV